MTTIVIDYHEGKAYSDRQTTRIEESRGLFTFLRNKWEYQLRMDTVKIHITPEGLIMGTGRELTIKDFVCNYPDKITKPTNAETTIVVVAFHSNNDGVKYYYEIMFDAVSTLFGYKWNITSRIVSKTYRVLGSGAKFAAGALAVKATPEESITAAASLDKYTNSNIDCIDIPIIK